MLSLARFLHFEREGKEMNLLPFRVISVRDVRLFIESGSVVS